MKHGRKCFFVLLTLGMLIGMVSTAYAMQLFIKLEPETTITLEVELRDPIEYVKLNIEDKTGFSLGQQILKKYDGTVETVLENDKTLEFYSIKDGQTLQLTVNFPIWVAGTQVTSDNAGDVLSSDPDNKGKVSYDPASNTLMLKGATITGNTGISYSGYPPLKIVLSSNNTVTGNIGSCIASSRGGLEFSGTGSLKVIGNNYGIYASFQNAVIIINGGKITAEGGNSGICSERDIQIEGGTVTAKGIVESGIRASSIITIGKKATVTSTSTSIEESNRALKGTVINFIPGTGWDNPNGTGPGTAIPVDTGSGAVLGYKKVQFLGEPDPTPAQTAAPTAAPTATPTAAPTAAPTSAPTPTYKPVPKTGDSANPALWLALIFLGLLGAAGTILLKARKR